MTLNQCWRLSKAWYAGRLEPEWRGLSPQEAQEVLASVGLTGRFWEMG